MKQVKLWKLKEEAESWRQRGREVKVLDSCNRDAYPSREWEWIAYAHSPVTEGYGGASVVSLHILIVKRG